MKENPSKEERDEERWEADRQVDHNKGLWQQMSEGGNRITVNLSNPPPIEEILKGYEEIAKWERQRRKDTDKDWPDISTWPEDLPDSVYQGSLCGFRGMYHTSMVKQLREAAKQEYQKYVEKKTK